MRLVIITLLLSLNLAAQSNNIINYKNQLLKFVPQNFEILDTVKGNLNNDSFDDYILVLKKKMKKLLQIMAIINLKKDLY